MPRLDSSLIKSTSEMSSEVRHLLRANSSPLCLTPSVPGGVVVTGRIGCEGVREGARGDVSGCLRVYGRVCESECNESRKRV